jgi:hypothetical protein
MMDVSASLQEHLLKIKDIKEELVVISLKMEEDMVVNRDEKLTTCL